MEQDALACIPSISQVSLIVSVSAEVDFEVAYGVKIICRARQA